MLCTRCVQLALLGIHSRREATFCEKAHFRITFMWQIIKPQRKYLNYEHLSKTVMMAKQGRGMSAAVGVIGRRERAATSMPLLRNGPPKNNRQQFLQGLSKKRQLSKHWSVMHSATCHLLFTTLDFVLCKCGVLLFLNHQDTTS